ncbi:MAG: DegT/DnrJ/EryC1/StrS family aminotransferase [Bacteroidetes bacterium]|nr:DegT/DnrJ/EryC1/StrS family aminotransferase [Bacteroidota bacterium]
MIPFSPPRIDQQIIDEVVNTLKSGWITTGPRTKMFEKRLAEYCNVPEVLCLNSATAGLELMLQWYGVKTGDEVIMPAYTYCATANVVIHCGAKPVFVDINDDFNISLKQIENAITEKTKVIMPVDIAGFPCDYDEINTLVKRADIVEKFQAATEEQKKLSRILVLSDAAHSLGAVYKGKKTGSLSDVTVFSFHAVKNLTTAEGGAVCLNLPEPFNNRALYDYFCIKSLHGQNKDALSKTKIGNWRYDVIEAGYKLNMTDIQAAMGLVELARYDADMLIRRKKIFHTYSDKFAKYSWAQLPEYESINKTTSYHVYLLRIKNITEIQRDEIISRIFEKQVGVNVHFIPLPLMSFYKKLGYCIENYPSTYNNYSREISLPVYYDLTDEQINIVADAVISSVEETRNIIYL